MENVEKKETPVEPVAPVVAPKVDDIDKLIETQKTIKDTKGVEVAVTLTASDKPTVPAESGLESFSKEDLVRTIRDLRKESGDKRIRVKELEDKLTVYTAKEVEEAEKKKTLEEKLSDRDVKIAALSKQMGEFESAKKNFESFIDERVAEEIAKVPAEFRSLIPTDRDSLYVLKYLEKAKKAGLFMKTEPVVINHSIPIPGSSSEKQMTPKDKIMEGLKNRQK